MSKLTQQLEVRKTGKEFALFNDVVSITEGLKEYNYSNHDKAKEYRIMVTLGASVVLSDSTLASNPEVLEYAIRETKESITEAVFGEFRQDIRTISRHLYDRDIDKALAALRDLDRKMFHE